MKSITAIEETQHGDKQHQAQADVKVSGTKKIFVSKKIFEKKSLI